MVVRGLRPGRAGGRGVYQLPEADGQPVLVLVHAVPEIARLDLVVERAEPRVAVAAVPRQPDDIPDVIVEEPVHGVGERPGIELVDLLQALRDLREGPAPGRLVPGPPQEALPS